MGLESYNQKLPQRGENIDVSNNFYRPPITPSTGNTSMNGWRGTTDFGNILNGTSGVDWNTQYTNWSLDSGTSNAADVATIFGYVTAGLPIAVAVGGGIAAIVQNNKAQKQAAAKAGDHSAQADVAISNAKELSNSTDIDALRTSSDELGNQIDSLESRQSEIDIPAAEQNVKNLKTQQKEYKKQEKAVEKADEKFADAVNNYTDLKNKLDKMSPDDEGYAQMKTQVEQAEKTMQEQKKSLDEAKAKLDGMTNPSDKEISDAEADLRQQKSDKNSIPKKLEQLKQQKQKIDNRIKALEIADGNKQEETQSSTPVTTPVTITQPNSSGNVFGRFAR